jgi:hypothetical protein
VCCFWNEICESPIRFIDDCLDNLEGGFCILLFVLLDYHISRCLDLPLSLPDWKANMPPLGVCAVLLNEKKSPSLAMVDAE